MKSSSFIGRFCLSPALWLVLIIGCIGLVIVTFTASPASAAFFDTPAPTQEDLWAPMQLPKPATTASPVLPPTDVPTATPLPTEIPAITEAPGQMTMEIVSAVASDVSPEQPAPAASYGGSKLILVDISEQHMYVYDGDILVYSFVVSTGMRSATRVGTFAVQSKIPNAYGSTWDIWMPNWLGIYYSAGLENGIHALPILSNGATLWAGYLGTPISYGCVVLDTYDSQLLYDWAEIGTPVKIQW